MDFNKISLNTASKGRHALGRSIMQDMIFKRLNTIALINREIDLSQVNTDNIKLLIKGCKVNIEAPQNPVARNVLCKRIKKLFDKTKADYIKSNVGIYSTMVQKYENIMKKIAFVDNEIDLFNIIPTEVRGIIKEKVLDEVFFMRISSANYVKVANNPTDEETSNNGEFLRLLIDIIQTLRKAVKSIK